MGSHDTVLEQQTLLTPSVTGGASTFLSDMFPSKDDEISAELSPVHHNVGVLYRPDVVSSFMDYSFGTEPP